jgi:hypothetical protein
MSWKFESIRHALARKGMKTGQKQKQKQITRAGYIRSEQSELEKLRRERELEDTQVLTETEMKEKERLAHDHERLKYLQNELHPNVFQKMNRTITSLKVRFNKDPRATEQYHKDVQAMRQQLYSEEDQAMKKKTLGQKAVRGVVRLAKGD